MQDAGGNILQISGHFPEFSFVVDAHARWPSGVRLPHACKRRFLCVVETPANPEIYTGLLTFLQNQLEYSGKEL